MCVEGTARGQPSTSREDSSRQNPLCRRLISDLQSPTNVCCFSRPFCGIPLRQPELTHSPLREHMCEWRDERITAPEGGLSGKRRPKRPGGGGQCGSWREATNGPLNRRYKGPHHQPGQGPEAQILFGGERLPLAGVVGAPRVVSPGRRLRHRTGERGSVRGAGRH